MSIEKEVIVFVMGIPVHDYPVLPTDEGQSGHEKQLCPGCDMLIWVSENNRKVLRDMKGSRLLCAYCCAKEAQGSEYVLHNILESKN